MIELGIFEFEHRISNSRFSAAICALDFVLELVDWSLIADHTACLIELGRIYRAYDRTSGLMASISALNSFDYPGAGSPTPTSFQLATSGAGRR